MTSAYLARNAGPVPSMPRLPSVGSKRLDDAAGRDERGHPSHSHAGSPAQLERAVWEREMKRLRLSARLLGAVLVALGVRVVVSGINVTIAVTAGIVTGLLVLCLVFTRQGRRLEPTSPHDRQE